MEMICHFFIILITIFICLARVIVGFGYFAVVRPLKYYKSFGEVIWSCNEVKSCLFTVCFPENNCTP